MSTSHGHTAQESAMTRVYNKKFSFLVVFGIVFLVMLSILGAFGFTPDSPSSTDTQVADAPVATVTTSSLMLGPAAAVSNTAAATQTQGEVPVKVVVSKIGLSQTVANPTTTNVEALDQYLLKGAVRYPTSATLGQEGTVILFGHSSYLPVVHNQAYKAFDGIQNLKSGDEIDVYSVDQKYVYSVTNVQQMSATSDGIPLTTSGHTLTLATCDSFGQKTDRFVVTATLVGSYALGS